MGESEDLCCLGIRSIYEDDWRIFVDEAETSKLLRVEFSMGIASDDAVRHDKDASVFYLIG